MLSNMRDIEFMLNGGYTAVVAGIIKWVLKMSVAGFLLGITFKFGYNLF